MMPNEMMDLEQLAQYIQRDKREVTKLANRGHLPGRKVSGEWRFARAEINHWLETQMAAYSAEQLQALESRDQRAEVAEPLIASLLPLTHIAVPLPASTKASALKELLNLAGRSWQVYDPDAILEAIRQREETASTALENGVALPHPHRPVPNSLGDHVLAYGRTASGIPFGAPRGLLTDIFFLVCCVDEPTHLRVLARLSRLLLIPAFADNLRAAESAEETWKVIEAAERALSQG